MHGQLTHDAFIKGLSPETRAQLTGRSDAPALRRLALHGGLIVTFGSAIAAGVPGWWALLLPQGIAIIFLFTLLHETIHRTAFATLWMNDRVAQLAGFLIAIPPNWFRQFHFAHHRHTQNPQKDPELIVDKPDSAARFMRHVSGLPTWWSALSVLIRNARGLNADPFVPRTARPAIMTEARWFLILYVSLLVISVAAGSALLLWFWVLPALLGQPFLRIYLLAEHGRCPMVANMFQNTRTTLTNRIVHFLAWNMPYHAEHHALPTVPFHRLPDLHRLAMDHLQTVEHGYARFTAAYVRSLGEDADAPSPASRPPDT